MSIDYSELPIGLQGGAQRWIENGTKPGSFLTAIIQNDLKTACQQADNQNRYLLFDIVRWFWNHAPSTCWGSVEKYDAWRIS